MTPGRYYYIIAPVHRWWRRRKLLRSIFWGTVVGITWLILFVAESPAKVVKWLMEYPMERVRKQKERVKREKADERAANLVARDGVKPLPRVRNRGLTLGSTESQSPLQASGPDVFEVSPEKSRRRRKRAMVQEGMKEISQRTIEQTGTSALFNLPYEVRDLIWTYAVGGHDIHIVRRRGRLGNVYCAAEHPLPPDFRDLCCLSRDQEGYYLPTAWPRDLKPLGLALTCRQIYSETIDKLYALNTFSFDRYGVLEDFFPTLLPHRRDLVASVNFSWNFNTGVPDPRFSSSTRFCQLYQPNNNSIEAWASCITILNALPGLRSLTVTPAFAAAATAYRHSRYINPFLEVLNSSTAENLHVTIPWKVTPLPVFPGLQSLAVPYLALESMDSVLPKTSRFTIERKGFTRGQLELLAFFIPFHIQCLHCRTYTIIRKSTKTFAESVTYFDKACLSRPGQPCFSSKSTYWTFHTHCRGWIEFQYDWRDEEWSVTQGAREVIDEEAEAHLLEYSERYPKQENRHERLYGLNLRDTAVRGWGESFTGKVLDVPTKERYYMNMGWRPGK
ncbi:hypothetical protein EJ04DRAFT_511840 [Polyplosphaeria fusca]|uniref:DUF7730 domain-containing protein n=1 Tax=Polyplosphaeria fusca TaxID=682080 RepID=A0A9P4R2G7_9PLEO|nr:hypothetical protein EJ04DRAFT_511840 [Polyplosphaeria fusca]